jgi:hypothetical protein
LDNGLTSGFRIDSADGKVKIGKNVTMLKCNEITLGGHDFVRSVTQFHDGMLGENVDRKIYY